MQVAIFVQVSVFERHITGSRRGRAAATRFLGPVNGSELTRRFSGTPRNGLETESRSSDRVTSFLLSPS
jgi:hypothetical protein